MTHVQFLFDFGSPNAYLAHQVIPEIARRANIEFDYIPVLLGGIFKLTGNKPPMVAFGGIKNKLDYEQLEMRRFIARHEITKFRLNPFFPVNTLSIMRGAVAAQMLAQLPPYVDAVFHHMWEVPRKMDDPEVIRAALTESGLDAAQLMERTEAPEVKETLLKNTAAAVEKGVFGIPSFFVGKALYFGKDRLRDVEEEAIRLAKLA